MICWVSYNGKSGQQPKANSDWRYGDVSPGYELLKECRALEPGKNYRVGVEASGPGGGGVGAGGFESTNWQAHLY
jgi:hypothetical protein